MNKAFTMAACLLSLAVVLACGAALSAADTQKTATSNTGGGEAAAGNQKKAIDEDTIRFEGEKRYSVNCGRCHQPPHKLSPRIMATAVRHMRVRATLTDEDMRYILWYMTR